MSHKIELSALLTIVSIILLFSTAVVVVLIAPSYVDQTWTQPTSPYQVQMYELSDPNVLIGPELDTLNHLRNGFSLLAFQESETLHIQAPPELEPYVTRMNEPLLKLTSRLLLLRPLGHATYELYDPKKEEAYSLHAESWIDKDYTIIDSQHTPKGVIYIHNPIESKADPKDFLTRKELIEMGEEIYAIEGCWYCHTDQTRTLVQDLVLNGSDSYPAPPSSANEYIYQKITFPGTKRNGPDLSRVGVKRPSRDWHKAHFWSPSSQSHGSIMPSFRHLFDNDPRGTAKSPYKIPHFRFEALFQYLMTKGTRITPPTQAWWLGKDPLKIKDVIDGH